MVKLSSLGAFHTVPHARRARVEARGEPLGVRCGHHTVSILSRLPGCPCDCPAARGSVYDNQLALDGARLPSAARQRVRQRGCNGGPTKYRLLIPDVSRPDRASESKAKHRRSASYTRWRRLEGLGWHHAGTAVRGCNRSGTPDAADEAPPQLLQLTRSHKPPAAGSARAPPSPADASA